jgi:hypothetical protein
MTPFHIVCPEPGLRETRCLHVLSPGGPLPVGEYAFLEFYCEDLACDCRRVLLQVTARGEPSRPVATINFGWESAGFYTDWMHGDKEAGRDITNACLDPIHPQSGYADHFLDYFQGQMMTDRAYVARLARHYELFKDALEKSKPPVPAAAPAPLPLLSMTTEEILRQLQHIPDEADFAPYRTALLAATLQRDTIIPELIAALDRVSANPAHYRKDHEDCLHLFAIYLLAQFREPRALDAFLRFFSLPGEDALNLTGDMVTEHGAAILASVCGGDPAPLLRLAQDESVNEFVRQQAIDGLLVQAGWGERPREAVIADLRRLFQTLPRPGEPYVWAALVGAVHDLDALELLPETRQAFAGELVDESVIGLDDIDPALSPAPRGFPRPTAEQRFQLLMERNALIDAVSECSCWLCFRDEEAEAEYWKDQEVDTEELPDDTFLPPDELPWLPPPIPYVAPPKVGRNDPCACGSGRKFKKCCGKN